MSDNGGEFFAGFVIGALAGAAAALFLTPCSGEEMRQRVEEKGIELRSHAEQMAEEARARAELASGDARSQATHVSDRGRIVVADNVRKAQEVVQKAQTKLSKPDDEPLAGSDETEAGQPCRPEHPPV